MAETEAETAARIQARFMAEGALKVEPGYLQPADVLLDLYGEDIRARAYTTHDPVHGEQMLRPDFTVPVVQMHMSEQREPARYTYAGPVWRRQDYGSTRAREFWQVGYEVFDGSAPNNADAEVFAVFAEVLGDYGLAPITGDLAILFAAIDALHTTEARKTALRRHVWRPERFERLLHRFSGAVPFDGDARDIPADPRAAIAAAGTHVGKRKVSEIAERLAALQEDQSTAPVSSEEVAMVLSVLAITGKSPACLEGLRAISRSFEGLAGATDNLAARLDALDARGVDVGSLTFDAQFGRMTMEYYDGFVFAFRDPASGENVATGGRYDALTSVLGQGVTTPAVGGVIRPDALARGEAT